MCRSFPKYVVSPEGHIKNREKNRVMHVRQNGQGFAMTNLMGDDNVRRTKSVALLVAQAYLGKPKNEHYNTVIHLDGDKSNCEASNLMWRPRWYAILYHRMFQAQPKDSSVYVEETGEEFGTLRELCVKYGLYEQHTFTDILNGDRCFHYNYLIRFID